MALVFVGFFDIKKKFFLIEVQQIYNVVFISALQQIDSVTHVYIFSYSLPLWFITQY